jgi:hypothetical protein
MWNPSKLLIIAIVAVGVAAGLFAWQHQYRRGAQVMELWGKDNTYRIRLAEDCELLRLARSSTDTTDTLPIEGEDWQIVRREDISQARGWVHARQALIQDVSYRWDSPDGAPATGAQWEVAIIFRDPKKNEQTTTLAIDLNSGAVCDIQTRRRGNVSPIVDGLKVFFDEQWQSANATE